MTLLLTVKLIKYFETAVRRKCSIRDQSLSHFVGVYFFLWMFL